MSQLQLTLPTVLAGLHLPSLSPRLSPTLLPFRKEAGLSTKHAYKPMHKAHFTVIHGNTVGGKGSQTQKGLLRFAV